MSVTCGIERVGPHEEGNPPPIQGGPLGWRATQGVALGLLTARRWRDGAGIGLQWRTGLRPITTFSQGRQQAARLMLDI